MILTQKMKTNTFSKNVYALVLLRETGEKNKYFSKIKTYTKGTKDLFI